MGMAGVSKDTCKRYGAGREMEQEERWSRKSDGAGREMEQEERWSRKRLDDRREGGEGGEGGEKEAKEAFITRPHLRTLLF
jgi:hypothetical protein